MFFNARLKLTFWYLLIIMTVSVIFSGIIFNLTTREVRRFSQEQRRIIQRQIIDDIENLPIRPRGMMHILEIGDEDLIAEVQSRTLFSLGIINGIILIVSGAFGYMLAGKTLRPIRNMVHDQKRFISDASHELKTPLTSLKIAFEVFLRERKPTLADAKRLIQDSVSEVDRLTHLSESLLTITTLQSSSNGLAYQKVVLRKVIDDAAKKIMPLAKKRRISLRKLTQANLTIHSDGARLSQVLVILLDNAIKYSPEKSTVTIAAKKEKSCVFISVKDEGVGIPQEMQSKIFQRFFRADSARTYQEGNGFGLGLSIAKAIIEHMRGTISVHSIKSTPGSTFTVKLPIS